MTTIKVAVVRQGGPKAIQVILAEWPHKIWWLPRSTIADGRAIRPGQRDITIQVEEWIIKDRLKPKQENQW